jgi:hypothetical protein
MDENSKNEFQDPFQSGTDLKDYGLPEVNFQPIEREEPKKINIEQPYKKEAPVNVVEKKEKNNFVPVLVGALVLVLIFAAAIYFLVFHNSQEVQTSEYVPYQPEINEVVEDTPSDFIPESFEASGTESESEAAFFTEEKKEGSITVVNQRSRRGYIVVGSFFDEDNASDFGNKLASGGVEVKLIRPDRYSRYYKLAVADYDSYEVAADEISNFKSNYGNQIWVLKY